MASDFLFVSNLLNYSSSYRFILIARIAWQTNSFIFLSENLGLFLWPFRSKTFFFVSVFMNRLAGQGSRGCFVLISATPPPLPQWMSCLMSSIDYFLEFKAWILTVD